MNLHTYKSFHEEYKLKICLIDSVLSICNYLYHSSFHIFIYSEFIISVFPVKQYNHAEAFISKVVFCTFFLQLTCSNFHEICRNSD